MQYNYSQQQYQQHVQYSPLMLQATPQNLVQNQSNQYYQIPTYCNYGTPYSHFTIDQLNLLNKQQQQQLQINFSNDLLQRQSLFGMQQQYNLQPVQQNNLVGYHNQYNYKWNIDNNQFHQFSYDYQPLQYVNNTNNIIEANQIRKHSLGLTNGSFSQNEATENLVHNLIAKEEANLINEQKPILFDDVKVPQQQNRSSRKQKTLKNQTINKYQIQKNACKSVKNNTIIIQYNQMNGGEQTEQLNQKNLAIKHSETILKMEQKMEQQLKNEFESTQSKQIEQPFIKGLKIPIKFENLVENMNEFKSFSTVNNQESSQNCLKSQDQKLINQKLALEKARQEEEQIKLQLIENLSTCQREILRLGIQTNRQNINRNFIKQYKLYVNTKVQYVLNYEKSDQQKYQFRSCKNQPVKLITDPTPQEKISFQKKFNKFIANKIYSNNDIKQIIENKIYGYLFKEFLNNEITDWIEQNINDRKQDYLCIVKFYLLCCQQNQYLCFMNDNQSLNRKNIQYFANF